MTRPRIACLCSRPEGGGILDHAPATAQRTGVLKELFEVRPSSRGEWVSFKHFYLG